MDHSRKRLREWARPTTWRRMISREQFRKLMDMPVVEWALFALGVLLIIAGFIIAPLPGPGGIFLIAPGLALVLKTSLWAKRHYVRLKRWQPKAGGWTDWALRRRSHFRRRQRLHQLQKQREEQGRGHRVLVDQSTADGLI